jgi:hypothetical protein
VNHQPGARGYPDLQDHLAALEAADLVWRIDEPINKDTEIHMLARWIFRGGLPEADRKAFLFTNGTIWRRSRSSGTTWKTADVPSSDKSPG